MRVFHQSYVRLCLLPPLFFSETTLITIGSEGINSRSPVLLSDMITSGNLASFQLFPRASPQPLRDLLYRSFFLVGKCFIAMCIVATGTSTSSHLTQEYPVPTHVTLAKLDLTLRDLLSAEFGCGESRHRTGLAGVHTLTLAKTGRCARPLKSSPKSLFPHSQHFFHQ